MQRHLKLLNKLNQVFRAVASLTVPGGQEFHFPHFFLKFWSIYPIFRQTLIIFFLILVLRVGGLPTREGPGYATASIMQVIILKLMDLLWILIVILLCISVWNHFINIWNMLKCNFAFRGMRLSTFSHDAVQFWPLLSESLVAHRIVKRENFHKKLQFCEGGTILR